MASGVPNPESGAATVARYRHPPEWAPHAGAWLAWPPGRRDWRDKFGAIPWVFAEIARKLAPFEPVRLIVATATLATQARDALSRAGAPLERIELLNIPVNRNWLRDVGPIFAHDPDGRTVILNFRFTAWGKYKAFRADERVPSAVAEARGIPIVNPEHRQRRIVLEGGAFDVNGLGDALATEECLLDQNVQPRNPGWTRDDYATAFGEWLGAPNILWLGRGIVGDDDTHGHVDDVARFVNERTIALARETDSRDPNYEALEENRERLQGARLSDGSRPEIVYLPMPQPICFNGRRLPASYLNFYIGNGVVLAPTYNDPADRTALGILAELFPGRTVVGIHAVDLALGLGAVHCLVHEEPMPLDSAADPS